MTEPTHVQVAILADGDGRAAYAVPLTVLDAHRAAPEQRAAIAAAMGEVEGFRLTPEASIHLLSAEALTPYALSDEQQAGLASARGEAAGDSDVTGHWFGTGGVRIGYGPNGAIVVTFPSTPGMGFPPAGSSTPTVYYALREPLTGNVRSLLRP